MATPRQFVSRATLALAAAALGLACATAACGSKQPSPAGPTNDESAVEEPAPSIESTAILDREPIANEAEVLHILIGWKDLAEEYPVDPRARERSREEAETLTLELHKRAAAGESFKDLMAEYSEDTSSAKSGQSFSVTPSAGLVLDFKRLSLRLEVDEVGIIRSKFGWHIIKRIA